MAQKQILIVCGEPSGDLNAAGLTTALKRLDPAIKISAVGGPGLRKAGAEVFYDIKELAVFGLFDVLKKLPLFFNLKKVVLKKINREKPDAVILVDFSGFNLRLACSINNSVPVIYYVSPQVWASRAGRIKTIRKYVRKMIVLFKFEEEFYRRHGINADFTGHPLLDTVRPSTEKDEFLAEMGLDKSKTAIPLLPGSRSSEIKHILPVMLKACQMIKKALPAAQFIIAKSPQVDLSFYSRTVKKYNLNLKIAEGRAYDCLNCADFSFVASGTATLESAIIGKPFLVIYKMGILNYLLYRPQVKVPFIGMANIVCGEKIVPEFIQFRARPRMIAEYVLKFLNDPRQQERQKEGFARLRQLLNPPGGYRRAAEAIMELISKK